MASTQYKFAYFILNRQHERTILSSKLFVRGNIKLKKNELIFSNLDSFYNKKFTKTGASNSTPSLK